MVIYTIGHSVRPKEQFLHLLKQHNIEAVIDVRHFPTSAKHPHFKRECMQQWLADADVRYYWLGDSLGGYRKGGYEAHMQTEAFMRGITELEAIARKHRAAIMCAEWFPWRCHRRFIAAYLESRGWVVIHIIDEKRTWQPRSKA